LYTTVTKGSAVTFRSNQRSNSSVPFKFALSKHDVQIATEKEGKDTLPFTPLRHGKWLDDPELPEWNGSFKVNFGSPSFPFRSG